MHVHRTQRNIYRERLPMVQADMVWVQPAGRAQDKDRMPPSRVSWEDWIKCDRRLRPKHAYFHAADRTPPFDSKAVSLDPSYVNFEQ